jgi:hypothetical protein
MPKAFILADDEKYLYKKVENFVVLKLPVAVKSSTNLDTQDIQFGFIMKTNSLRAKREPFEMSVPMFINVGRLRRPAPAQ